MRIRRIVAGVVLIGVASQVVSFVLVTVVPGESRSFTGVHLDDVTPREVTFRNGEQGLELAGLLFLPEGVGSFPGAAIIHGSGTSQRDNGWYLTLVSYLQDQGIAVLLPDKRGSGRSQGDWRTASFDDLATDAVAGIEFLGLQDGVDPSRLGVIGMSQGGTIAPLVAGQSTQVGFVVSVVGGAVPMHELLVYEETHNLREYGVLPGVSDVIAVLTSFLLRKGAGREFWDAVGNFDPLPSWRALSTDALVLYGELDTNVPAERSAARMRSLHKPNIDVRIYAGSGHALEDPPGQGNRIFRDDALEDIRDFIVLSTSGGQPPKEE